MKKILSLLLCAVMIGSSIVSGSARAEAKTAIDVIAAPIAEDPKTGKTNDPSNKALEAAIKAVKAKITIPKEYSEFNYNFYSASSYADTYWSLTWRNPDNYSYIQVNCDQGNNIIYYYNYDSSEKMGGVAAYLKKELKSKAEDFIIQINPKVYANMEFVGATYDGVYSGTYNYSFQRITNGISFPDNSVNVSVDSVTGKVRSATIHWLYDIPVPSSKAKLTKEEAADIISKNLKMKLVYRTNYYRIYDKDTDDYVKKAFLVYEPDPSYISVDAKTGKVYLTRSEWVEADLSKGGSYKYAAEKEDAAADNTGSISLTEEEIAKINELEKLITKEKAIQIVTDNKYLYIDKSMMAYSAYLNKSYNSSTKKSQYIWYIDLQDARPVDYQKDKDTYRAYANATVDAKTGKILSFSASLKSNYDDKTGKWNSVKIKYDKETCQKTLEKFLKTEINSRFKNTKLVEQKEDYIAYYKDKDTPVYGGYSYQYNRFNEGIEYSYNYIGGCADGVTGKIYSYNTNWDDDVVFESPKGAMTPEEAFKKYISNEGYHLVYEVNEINTYDPNYQKEGYYDVSGAYTVDEEIRLVYRPDVEPPYISPFTGEQLEYDGEVHKDLKPYTYTDIADTQENRGILLLADMNIGFEGDLFYPDKAITTGELSDLFNKIIYYYADNNNSSADDASRNKLITREEIAYDMVKRLGLEKVAKLQGIYYTGYNDQANIGTDYLGAVALAKGLGLLSADASNNFNPKSNITRAEAVKMIMGFIKAQREGVY